MTNKKGEQDKDALKQIMKIQIQMMKIQKQMMKIRKIKWKYKT